MRSSEDDACTDILTASPLRGPGREVRVAPSFHGKDRRACNCYVQGELGLVELWRCSAHLQSRAAKL